jgi:hypothetical protein
LPPPPPGNPPGTPPPPTPPLFSLAADDDKLSVEWRSCLLRAGRYRLLALEGELERHRNLDSRYAQAVIDATVMEMDCLQAGIAWLWRHPVA